MHESSQRPTRSLTLWLARLEAVLRAGSRAETGLTAAPARWVALSALALAGSYGVFMGCFAWRTRGLDGLAQVLASTIKLPLVYLLTLAVTLPSLCVFGALSGVPMRFAATARALLGAVLINAALAASLGPILGFFTLSTTSYPFIVLLNVALLGLCGVVACLALIRSVRRTGRDDHDPSTASDEPAAPSPSSPAPRAVVVRVDTDDTPRTRSTGLVLWWVILYALVGTQMGWVLRPLIGAPGGGFALFRPTEGTAIGAIARTIRTLVGW